MISEPVISIYRGMTLIEVLITLSILSTALLGLASLQQYGYAANALALQRTEAVGFAHEQIDSLRMMLMAAPQDVITSGQDSLGPPSSDSTIEHSGLTTRFDRIWTVDPVDNGRLARVSVTITWNDNSGAPHEISLDSSVLLTPY